MIHNRLRCSGVFQHPASDDTYAGLAGHGGSVHVYDFGGTADRLDFRPLNRNDVILTAVDLDDNGTAESLRAATGETTAV